MRGIDTNVLIRYLIRDDPTHYERARRLINGAVGSGEPVLVSQLVLMEAEWVLRSRYDLPKSEILATFSTLLEAAQLAFEDEPAIEAALYSWKNSAANFADCLIVARNGNLGCRATSTFDSKALKLPGFIAV